MSYMKLNVKLVGLTSGFSVGVLGPTHECITDLAIMQALPNIAILSPADGIETVKAVMAAAEIDDPVYLRLTGSMNSPIVYKNDFDYQVGKAIELREGLDLTIIATGSMVTESMKAAKKLNEQGISASVVDMHTIRPLDGEAIKKAAESPLVVTVEEHGVTGGLGGAIAQFLAKKNIHARQINIGVPCEYSPAASYQGLLEKYGLTGSQIAETISKAVRG